MSQSKMKLTKVVKICKTFSFTPPRIKKPGLFMSTIKHDQTLKRFLILFNLFIPTRAKSQKDTHNRRSKLTFAHTLELII